MQSVCDSLFCDFMIQFIYGMAGTGKSTLVYDKIAADLAAGKKVLLLTPEQQAILAERALAQRTANINTLDLEVLSFRRLANRVARIYGGLCYRYLDDGGKFLMLWATAVQTAPHLALYQKQALGDMGFLERLSATFAAFGHSNLSPEQLEEAATKMADDHPFVAKKLKDLSLLYSVYQTMLHKDHADPEDDLLHLADQLCTNKPFAEYTVYIDAFQGYTAREFLVLEALLPHVQHATITLTWHPAHANRMLLSTANDTKKRLQQIVSDAHLSCAEPIVLSEPKRFNAPALVHLADNLFDGAVAPTDIDLSPLSLFACTTPMQEAQTIAREIIKCTMRGMRYREIAIVTRDISRYSGILDVTLASYNIPYFYSQREPLATKPVYRLVLSALDVIRNGFRAEDIAAYLKTGYSGLSDEEIDLLLSYLETWNIYGRRWHMPDAWNMNPDGYSDTVRKGAQEILKTVADLRARVAEPLLALENAFSDDATVQDILCALVTFLQTLGVAEQIKAEADGETIALYNRLMHAFDQLAAVAGETAVTAPVLSKLLSCIISRTDYGTIPAFVDQVLIGDAARIRTAGIKKVFLLGANEGVFPQAVSDADLFTETERIALETYDICTTGTDEARNADELFYAYRAATLASEEVALTYSSFDFSGKTLLPSFLVDRLHSLFPNLQPTTEAELSLQERVYHFSASFADAILHKNTDEGRALTSLYAEKPIWAARLDAFAGGLESDTDTLPPKPFLPGEEIALTQSRIDQFVKCPLSYHCQYTLGLAKEKSADFSALDVGNLIHRMLELVLQKLHDGTKLRTDATPEELDALLDAEIATYISLVVGIGGSFTKRMENLFAKLRRQILILLENILKEFAQSEFTPQFFEMCINKNADAEPFVIPLANGASVYLYGKIDRVDTYVKDGTTYLRIVDYKKSKKEFHLDDVMQGLNLQMLLYLFGLWKNPSPALRQRVGDTEEKMVYLPAGILYLTSVPKAHNAHVDADSTKVIETAERTLTRSGLLLRDVDILTAMDGTLDGKFIPIKAKDLASDKPLAALATLEEFGTLLSRVSDIVAGIVKELRAGKAAAKPLTSENPCRYCHYLAVCRTKKKIEASTTDAPTPDA